jgi:hypothetical protein
MLIFLKQSIWIKKMHNFDTALSSELLECAVAHLVFLRDAWIRTQESCRRACSLATHLPI